MMEWVSVGLVLAVSATIWAHIARRIRQIQRALLYLESDSRVTLPGGMRDRVSVLVPARNEEREIFASLRSLAAQDYPHIEILLVDDESTDQTVARAREALDGCAAGRILVGRPRPETERWIGKSWAVTQAADQATGDWFWLTDADVAHHPAALRLALAEARTLGVDALSVMPAIECRTRWEKMLMPLFTMLSALMEPLDKANAPHKEASRFSGAFILIRREAYESIGGHRALREEILEDMAMAQRLKAAGRPVRLVYTHTLSRTRMYDRFRDAWQGLVRFAYPMLKYSPLNVGLAFLAAFFGAQAPWIALIGGLVGGLLGWTPGWLAAGVGALLVVIPLIALRAVRRILQIPPGFLLLVPAAAGLMCAAAMYSAFCHYRGRGLVWKGRSYRNPNEAAHAS